MKHDKANCKDLSPQLEQLGIYLDEFLKFNHGDAMMHQKRWKEILHKPLPVDGIGIDKVISMLGEHIVLNGSPIPKPTFTSFITTGATNVGVLANLAVSVAAPQRIGHHAFSFLEELSLKWISEMFGLSDNMEGVYSSGGSTANILALGAARQWAYEKIDIDPAQDGIGQSSRIYASSASHHTIHRAAAVLGLGRNAVTIIDSDMQGRLLPKALEQQIKSDIQNNYLPVAIIANAGTTGTGSIDPLERIAEIAKKYSVWFHVDGAYGLPGILDERVKPQYEGLHSADSVIVDPHKWLGAPVGIGATYVRDRKLLHRAFKQGDSDYLEGACTDENIQHSLDDLGIPYHDYGLELSAPSRGAVVWALITEIGKAGFVDRVCRHNQIARDMAERVKHEDCLQLLIEPTLSICCFRYFDDNISDINELNRNIHRELIRQNQHLPSTTVINGQLAIRPCFIGARTEENHAFELIDEVIRIGKQLCILKNAV